MNNSTEDLIIPVQFAIAGFEKCGTSSLVRDVFMKGISSSQHQRLHQQLYIPNREIHYLDHACHGNQGLDLFKTLFEDDGTDESDDNHHHLIKGFKNPDILKTTCHLKMIQTHFPSDFKFIISLRHPVKWFQSWYNFRLRNDHWSIDSSSKRPVPPTPEETIGFCGEVCIQNKWPKQYCVPYKDEYGDLGNHVCAGYGNYHVYLSRLGFTPMNTTEELDLLGGLIPSTFHFPKSMKLLLMEIGQMDTTTTATRSNKQVQVLVDMEAFLGLRKGTFKGNLPIKEKHPPSNIGEINICSSKYDNLRKELLMIGTKAADWIILYLLKSAQVTVAGNHDDFIYRLQQWKVDPCQTIIDDDTHKTKNATSDAQQINVKAGSQYDTHGGLCPSMCNEANCFDSRCKFCELTCGGDDSSVCTYQKDRSINFQQQQQQQQQQKKNNNNNRRAVNLWEPTFVDVTKSILRHQSFYEYPQIGRPITPESAPLFVDLNGDNILDFFHGSHHKTMGKMIVHPPPHYDDSKQQKATTTDHYGDSPNNNVNHLILNNNFELQDITASHISQYEKDQGDVHGNLIVDLDGDGVLDLIRAVGGGQGGLTFADGRESIDNAENRLFWGVDHNSTDGIPYFDGGIQAAIEAKVTGGVQYQRSRGRMFYLLDVNGDGLLDLYFATDRPRTDHLVPGRLLINQGNRRWEVSPEAKEYSTTMLLTDVDGDGFANEFVITRDHCFPQHAPPYPKEILDFCRSRPVGTTAVYKYDHHRQQMVDIGKKYSSAIPTKETQPACCQPGWGDTFETDNNNCYVRSSATADFDDDEYADQIFLYSSKLVFFFSSERPKGTLPFGDQWVGLEIHLPDHCFGKSIRVYDFDNDGREEILVGCFQVGNFLIYSRRGSGKYNEWLPLDASSTFGDLGWIDFALPNNDDYKEACRVNNTRFCWQKGATASELKSRNMEPRLAGITTVDFNNDGFMDIVVANDGGHLLFFQNAPRMEAKKNRFIAIKLVGDSYAIGATIILHSTSCPGCDTQFREVSSHQHETDKWGYKDERIIFGLGSTGVPQRVVVRWANGQIQTQHIDSGYFQNERASSSQQPLTISQKQQQQQQQGSTSLHLSTKQEIISPIEVDANGMVATKESSLYRNYFVVATFLFLFSMLLKCFASRQKKHAVSADESKKKKEKKDEETGLIGHRLSSTDSRPRNGSVTRRKKGENHL